jgi:hypothetical protein
MPIIPARYRQPQDARNRSIVYRAGPGIFPGAQGKYFMTFSRRVRCVFIALALCGQSVATELQEHTQIGESTQQAFVAEDFAKLEALSQAYRSQRSRTASGLWKLTVFYAGIEAATQTKAMTTDREAAFAELDAKTMRWAKKYPDSPAAYISRTLLRSIPMPGTSTITQSSRAWQRTSRRPSNS